MNTRLEVLEALARRVAEDESRLKSALADVTTASRRMGEAVQAEDDARRAAADSRRALDNYAAAWFLPEPVTFDELAADVARLQDGPND